MTCGSVCTNWLLDVLECNHYYPIRLSCIRQLFYYFFSELSRITAERSRLVASNEISRQETLLGLIAIQFIHFFLFDWTRIGFHPSPLSPPPPLSPWLWNGLIESIYSKCIKSNILNGMNETAALLEISNVLRALLLEFAQLFVGMIVNWNRVDC